MTLHSIKLCLEFSFTSTGCLDLLLLSSGHTNNNTVRNLQRTGVEQPADLLVMVKVAKAKAKVLCQPFGKGGKGKCSLAQTDVVPPTARLGSLQHSSLPHSLTPGGRPFRISLRLMNQARMQWNSRCWSWKSWRRLGRAWFLNFHFPLPPLPNHLYHLYRVVKVNFTFTSAW